MLICSNTTTFFFPLKLERSAFLELDLALREKKTPFFAGQDIFIAVETGFKKNEMFSEKKVKTSRQPDLAVWQL